MAVARKDDSQRPPGLHLIIYMSWKRISTLTRVETGFPSFVAGANCHFITASIALWSISFSNDFTTFGSFASPCVFTITEISTVPEMRKPFGG